MQKSFGLCKKKKPQPNTHKSNSIGDTAILQQWIFLSFFSYGLIIMDSSFLFVWTVFLQNFFLQYFRLPSSPSENGDLLENGDILSGNNKSNKTKGSDKEISEAVVHQATLPGDQKSNQKTTASVTRKVTDFFQIRRSSRKPKTEIEVCSFH